MAESQKLRTLRELRANLEAGKLTEKERKQNVIADVDGRHIRLGDPVILAVIDRRIAAEEAA